MLTVLPLIIEDLLRVQSTLKSISSIRQMGCLFGRARELKALAIISMTLSSAGVTIASQVVAVHHQARSNTSSGSQQHSELQGMLLTDCVIHALV